MSWIMSSKKAGVISIIALVLEASGLGYGFFSRVTI